MATIADRSRTMTTLLMTILLITTGIHTFRAIAGIELGSYFTGGAAASQFIPSLGDFLVGATAPIIVFLLWKKRGLGVWVAAIIWNVVGAWDNSTAQILFAFIEQNPAGPGIHIIMNFVLALHVANFYMLSRSDVRRHYLDQ